MPESDKTLKIDIDSGSAVELHKSAKTIVIGAPPEPKRGAGTARHRSLDTGDTAVESSTLRRTGLFKTKLDIDEFISKTSKPSLPAASLSKDEIKLDGEKLECSSNVADRYERLQEFAEGGHGSISLAMDKSLKRLVALKSLKHEFLDEGKVVKSFVSEARLTAQLEHPSVVPIYSMERDSSDGLHLAMKLVKGKTLKEYLSQIIQSYNREGAGSFDERKSLSFRLDIFLRVCDALSYAHSRNVMHCDLKPENIMIGEYRETYLMDWGIARLVNEPDFDPAKWVKPKSISGTPKYLSPEAISGEHTDQRADIYAMGMILFEMVCLRSAVLGNDNMEVMTRIRAGDLEPVRHKFGARVDADLKAIICKALETSRDKRYQTVAELSEDIRRYLRFAEVSANPDTIPMKCVRWLYSHRLAFAGSIMAAMLIGALGIAFALYERMNSIQTAREREKATSEAHSLTLEAAFKSDRVALHLEGSLKAVADEAAFLLRVSHDAPLGRVYSSSDLADDAKAPEDMAYSPVYKMKLSPGHFIYKASPGMDSADVARDLQKLAPLGRKLPYSVMESSPDANVSPEGLAMARRDLLEKGYPMRWIYLGLEDGFFMSYPGKGSYPASYDPRLRPWYKEGSKQFRAHWASPYVDTGGQGIVLPCTVPIRDDDDKLYGVAGMDFAFDFIVERMNGSGNPADVAEAKYMVGKDGRIVVSTNSKYKGLSIEPGTVVNELPELPVFPDMELFKTMSARGYGSILRSEAKGERLYSFANINTLSLIYIEVLDFEKLLDKARRREAKGL